MSERELVKVTEGDFAGWVIAPEGDTYNGLVGP